MGHLNDANGTIVLCVLIAAVAGYKILQLVLAHRRALAALAAGKDSYRDPLIPRREAD